MFRNIKLKKYISFFIVIFNTILLSKAYAETILVLPDNIQLEEINKDRKKKLSNRYNSVEQVENQYKGKLKYMPNNNGVSSYREGRFYTSIFFFIKGFPMNKINSDEIKAVKSENSFAASIGYYFYDFLAMEVEYFEYIHSLSDINIKGINKFKMDTKNYILNILIESNYSRFIPFIGAGIGLLNNNFRDSNVDKLKGGVTAVYQFLAGFEIAFNESLLFSFKYRGYYDTMGDIRMLHDNDKFNIKFDWRNNFNIGFKYIW